MSSNFVCYVPQKHMEKFPKCISGALYSMTIPLRKGNEYYPYSERSHMHS